MTRLLSLVLAAFLISATVATASALEADKEKRKAALRAIIAECRSLPILDSRSDDEILGYNDRGTFD